MQFKKSRNVVYEAYTTSVKHHLEIILNDNSPYMLAYRKYCFPLELYSFFYSTEILKRVVIDLEDGSLGVDEVVAIK